MNDNAEGTPTVQPNEIADILNHPISQELLARDLTRLAYGGSCHIGLDSFRMVRIVVTPTWAKLIDFETTLPSAVEELARQRNERQSA